MTARELPLDRVRYLDGLRGFAVIQIMLLSIVSVLFPHLLTQDGARDAVQEVITDSPVHFLYDGMLAVFVFFLISGYVLSHVYEKSTNGVVSSIIARYVRLVLPCLGSAVLAFILSELLGRYVGYGDFNRNDVASVTQGLRNIFFDTMLVSYGDNSPFATLPILHGFVTSSQTAVNPLLWSIGIEMWGSILLILICAAERRFGERFATTSAAIIGLFVFRSPLILFIIGYLYHRYPIALSETTRSKIWMYALIVVSVCLSLSAQQHAFQLIDAVSSLRIGLPPQSAVNFQLTLAALCVFIPVMRLRFLHALFETQLFQFLGRYSFALFLVHYPVIRFIGLYIARIDPEGLRSPDIYGVMATLLSITVSFLIAGFFTWIDTGSIRVSHRIRNLLSF